MIRSVVFHVVVFIFTAVYSSFSVGFVFFLPFKTRYKYLSLYSRAIIFFCKTICDMQYQVDGLENLKKHKSFVVLSKHQSQWETFFLVNLLHPFIFVCKKELLKLPMGVGKGIGLMRPITIDRSRPKQSLKDIITQGKQRLLEDKLPVLMFPEGTRTKPGKRGRYARSGAALAVETGVPLVFVSHNAGVCWPPRQFLKIPGLIKVTISEPVATENMNSAELTEQAADWIEGKLSAG